ncbi:TetR/AcrR family transcriptional regulator [Amycolatopsis anabasis]|uniref:TetR/AcrR family transcriptional regulator n=1 Tax=Amycolatopsis anabasis TaxID=1840409 RepID=UPI00131BCEC0|nr:TetR/AcrR family transcriptional regulator [Amycolatopsis anabasis]
MGRTSTGLRELRKQQTRDSISHVATRLFIERGYDAVTIADVAAAAGVAKMTVTNHFPRKEDLVLDLHEELVAAPSRAVAEREPGESALTALRRWYLARLDERDALLGFSGPEFVRTIADSPALLGRIREIHEHLEQALAETLAEAAGVPVDDIEPRVVAGQLTATLRVLFHEVFRRTLAGEDNPAIAAGLRDSATAAFDLLEPSLGAYPGTQT